jgi:glucosamine--fructose-6-phosphate aminotransferase (isomerizing)
MTSYTEREILSQPEVWRQTIDALDPLSFPAAFGGDITEVVVTGCGSTHYLAMSAAASLREAGLQAIALPASELMEVRQRSLPRAAETLLLAISRSGTTSETLMAVERFREVGGRRVAAISCYSSSSLVADAHVSWVAEAAHEESVAQTRSFSSMQVIVSAMVATLMGGDLSALQLLPDAADHILEVSRPEMRTLAHSPAETFFFLGGGPLYGIASEGMLKLKEMSLTASEAYHPMEFRHGPMSMCDDRAAVVSLVTPERERHEVAVIGDVAPFGPRIVTIGASRDVDLPQMPGWARPALYLLPLQLLALERAVHKGLDPDKPRHLTAVIQLDAADQAS